MNPDTQYIQSLRQSSDAQYLDDLYNGENGAGRPDMQSGPYYDGGNGDQGTVTTEPSSDFDPVRGFQDTVKDNPTAVIWPLGIIVGSLLIWIVIRLLRRLHPVAGAESDHKMGEDTIYNHKWTDELNAAIDKGRYGEAAVLCYLYRLWQLDDEGMIEFSSAKTPGIFIDELREYIAKPRAAAEKPREEAEPAEAEEAHQPSLTPDGALLDDTSELTRQYLRSRYGHKAISREEALNLRSIIGL